MITPREVVRFLREGALFALVLAAAAGGAAYFVTSNTPPVYSARVGVVASQSGSSTDFAGIDVISPPPVDPGVYQSAIFEGGVVSEALRRLEGTRPSERALDDFLQSLNVRVEDAQRSSTIWIEIRHGSPEYAADAVNLIAEELVAWDRERARRALDRSAAAIERSIANLQGQLAAAEEAGNAQRAAELQSLLDQRTLELQAAQEASSSSLAVGLLEPLRVVPPPEEPVGPRVVFRTFVAVVLGFVLGYAMQLLRWTLGTRIGGRDEVMAATGLPVLAEFPTRPRGKNRVASEAAGFFHTNVALATRDAHPRVIAVTSPMKPFERAGVAISLAETFARSGQRTLLVDADLRHPGVTESLDLVPSSAVPFDAYLADPDARQVPVSVAIGRTLSFDFVPSFTSERFPVDLLNEGFQTWLGVWKGSYDVIVLDCAPVVPFADTLAIAPSCTGLVLCASALRSTRDQVEDALDLLERPHIPVLGIALTDVRGRREGRRKGSAAGAEQAGGRGRKTKAPTSR